MTTPRSTLKLLVLTATALLPAMHIAASSDKLVFDFATNTNTAAWRIVNDDVMGGLSRSSFRLTNGVAVFRGEVSPENNGGFIV